MEGSDTKDNAATAERRTTICPTLVDAIAASQYRLAPRPGLEPGTCGLTVRRFKRRINANDQVLICFPVGSVFGHLIAVNAP